MKHPIIKYPYLLLSAQIESLLKVPGVEVLLNDWHKKPQKLGKYGDIFDGDVCHIKLRAPNGTLFFFKSTSQDEWTSRGTSDRCQSWDRLVRMTHTSLPTNATWP